MTDRLHRVKNKLADMACETVLVIGIAFFAAISIGICEVIIVSLMRFCAFVSGHEFPKEYYRFVEAATAVVIGFLVISISWLHIKGFKMPPDDDEDDELELPGMPPPD